MKVEALANPFREGTNPEIYELPQNLAMDEHVISNVSWTGSSLAT